MYNGSLLFIAYYFPPMGLSGVQRSQKFVKYLPEYGWKTTVLTSTPSTYYAFDESLMAELDRDGIEIIRTSNKDKTKPQKNKTKKFPSYSKQKFGRYFLQAIYQPDSKIRWKNTALKFAEKILSSENISAIFATAPPFTDFLIARELSEKYDKPFIVDYRDVWVDNPFHYYPTPFHKNYSIKLETDILTHADKVIVTTRDSKEILLKRYRFLSHDDIIIIPHGYDPADFESNQNIKPTREKLVITHSGLFQDDRTPKYFLQAIANFISRKPEAKSRIEARFVGLMRKNHLKLIEKLNLSNQVSYTGYLPHSEAVKHLLESDVLWLMLNDTVRSPGKLYEYFGARKPLLICSPDGAIRRTALESKAAIATNPKDISAIEKAIATFYNQWKSNELPVPDEAFIQQFDRKALTGELARELSLIADI